ncbi:hypothetical protein N7539_003513 [Penicillium diatomitis]|uniref:Alpha/beta hydrolase fold-3 domain-containing protein n=1 Tax=Penicillium diatomitis TaxID=2819901 RepID=A0A9X0BXR9_9EURO|nr:uncharacterized protein N7539_003513 [Penicillium diatomitis]KAJ5488623.1 hypothetical protein N7539_003513 [Penicillium diatomitis]
MDFSEYTGPSAEWLAIEPTLPAMPQMPPLELRDMVNKGREELAAEGIKEIASQVQMQDYIVTTRDGASLEVRTYRPSTIANSEKLPVYIHLHGGGYLFGTLASEDGICSRIVVSRMQNNTPVVVLNVNYRHTPEHQFPIAWYDVEDAFVWLHDNIDQIGGLADQVVVGGISAGAHLTASLTLTQLYGDNERVKSCPRIRGQVLMIPALVSAKYYGNRKEMLRSPEVSSYVTCANAPILPVSRIDLFMKLLNIDRYPNAARDLRMNPGNVTAEEVKGLPPTTFGVAGNDPLRDEGLLFAKMLCENGVPADVHVFPGLPHGFRRWFGKSATGKKWDDVMSGGISWALSNPTVQPFTIKVE